MGEAINIIAHDESIKDWADFNKVFAAPWYDRLNGTGLGFSVAMKLAIYLNENTEVKNTLMDPNKATACQKDALGLKDEFMANGYETIKHFANSFAVGSLLATAYGLTRDQGGLFRDMLLGDGDPLQRIAEMTADFVGGKISDEFGEMLANSTPFWADKEYFDEAWNKNKHKIKELWLSNFCRARDNSLKCEC